MADTATFCPKCGTPSAATPATPATPAAPTAPVAPATPAVPATPTPTPLTNPSSAINGFGAIASTPTPPPAPTPAPTPTPPPAPAAPIDSVDPLVASKTTTSIPDSEPITPDVPPAPLKDKSVSSKGLKMPGKRTLILIAIVLVLLIGAAIAVFMFVLPSGNNTASNNTPVAPAVETPAPATTNKALLSGFSFEVPSDYTMELFTDINGNPVLQIAKSDNSWAMDLTYLGTTLFSSVAAEGALDNQIMLLNAQTNSESTSDKVVLSDLDVYYVATNYNNTPVTIFYASAPAAEGADPCTFAGIIVSDGGESGEPVLAPAAEILASAEISTANPISDIANGADFSGLISILGQGFTTPVTPEESV